MTPEDRSPLKRGDDSRKNWETVNKHAARLGAMETIINPARDDLASRSRFPIRHGGGTNMEIICCDPYTGQTRWFRIQGQEISPPE